MPENSRPPRAYQRFTERYPLLAEAWDKTREAEKVGPLDEPTARLIKLAVAIGSMREGAVHSAVRKAKAAGVDPRAVQQVVSLAASTLGFPATVAVSSWVQDVLDDGTD